MAPPIEAFPPWQLPHRATLDLSGKRRKPAAAAAVSGEPEEGTSTGSLTTGGEGRVGMRAGGAGGAVVDLKKCALKELVQYDCDLDGPSQNPASKVVCVPVLRLFRRCANGLLAETTAWEGVFDESPNQPVAVAGGAGRT